VAAAVNLYLTQRPKNICPYNFNNTTFRRFLSLLINILLFSAIVERIWEHTQQLLGEKYLTRQFKVLGSAVLAISTAVAFELDLLYALAVTTAPGVPGIILTGFAVGLGSNVIHDLVDIVNTFSKRPAAERAER
jgi:hypothetical protein